jgi:excisionase family DNA binding protein
MRRKKQPIIRPAQVISPITVRVPQAVDMTGLSRSRIYELIKSGEIEIVKFGASTLIVVESLKCAVNRRRRISGEK